MCLALVLFCAAAPPFALGPVSARIVPCMPRMCVLGTCRWHFSRLTMAEKGRDDTATPYLIEIGRQAGRQA